MLRGLWRSLTVSAAAVACLALTATTAYADCHGDGVNSGNEVLHKGATGSTQTIQWSLGDASTFVKSVTGNGMTTDICLEARSDWMTESGHYDARASRNCAPGTSRSGTWVEPSNWGGSRTVTGLQKAGGCRYIQDDIDPKYDCDLVPQSEPGCPIQVNSANFWWQKNHAMYLRRENGQTEVNDGGDVDEPAS